MAALYKNSKTLRAAYRRVFTRHVAAGVAFYRHATPSHASLSCETESEYADLCGLAKPLGYTVTLNDRMLIKMNKGFHHTDQRTHEHYSLNWLEICAPDADPVSAPVLSQPARLVLTGSDFNPPEDIALDRVVLRYQTQSAAQMAGLTPL